MKALPVIFGAAAVAALAPTHAGAAALTVVNVNAPAVNCAFNVNCAVIVEDTVGTLQYSPLGNGARLQSRTYEAKPGTPAAGHTAYLYRVDLTQGVGWTNCLVGVTLDFGPVAKVPYVKNQKPAEVFVITTGGIGTVGIKSAEQDGNAVTFTFSDYLCAGKSSHFFGLAAAKPPQKTGAALFGIGSPPFVQAAARVPQH